MAKRAGVSRDTISNAERGQHSLQATSLSKIARALGRAPSDLLAEEERLAPKARSSSLEPSLFNGLEDEQHTADRVAHNWTRMLEHHADFVLKDVEKMRSAPGSFLSDNTNVACATLVEYRRVRGMLGIIPTQKLEAVEARLQAALGRVHGLNAQAFDDLDAAQEANRDLFAGRNSRQDPRSAPRPAEEAG